MRGIRLGRRLRAAGTTMALLVAGMAVASAASPVAAQEPAPDVPLDLETLDPVAVSTWGVVGVGQTLSDQELPVWDFAQIGDRLYIAGSFTHVQEHQTATPIAQAYVAAFDVDTGDYLPEFAPVLDRTAYDLEVHAGRLLVGGEFTTVNGVAREALVALDPVTGATDPSMPFSADRPFSPTKPGIVRVLEVDGDTLYLGGNFNYINKGTGSARSRAYGLGRVDLATNRLDAGWAPRTTGSGVWDIAVDSTRDRVSFVGFFTAVDAMPDTALMATVSRLDGTLVPGLTPFEPNSNQTATVAIVYAEDKLFVGGAQHVAQVLDANTNTRTGYHTTGVGCTAFDPRDCDPKYVAGGDFQVLEVIDGYVLGGCHCFGARPSRADYIGSEHYNTIDDKWDGDKFVIPLDATTGGDGSDWIPDLTGNIDSGTWAIFADDNGCLYLGGDYERKGPLGFAQWLGGFAKYCPAGDAPVIDTVVSTDLDVFLTWSPPSQGVAIEKYRVFRDGVFAGSTTGLTYADTNLVADAEHDYTLQAVAINGTRTAHSDPVSVTVAPADTTAPAAPTTLGATAIDDTTVTLSWDAAVDDQIVKSYFVYRDWAYLGLVSATAPLEFGDSGLTAGETYRYHVRAKDHGGNVSASSTPLFVTTTGGAGPDTTPPTVATGVAVDSVGDQTVDIIWEASSDDDSGVKAYLVYRDWAYIGRTLASEGLGFTDTGLTNGQSYRYHVRVKDHAGNVSDPSAPVFATPEVGA